MTFHLNRKAGLIYVETKKPHNISNIYRRVEPFQIHDMRCTSCDFPDEGCEPVSR